MREQNKVDDEIDDDEFAEWVRRVDAGEQVWSESDEVVDVVFKKPLDRVVSVRLTADKWNALYREAVELGIGPTTLARMWLLERLRAVEAGRSGGIAVREESVPYVKGKPTARRAKTPGRPPAAKKSSARSRKSR